jgi:hypothetical protein
MARVNTISFDLTGRQLNVGAPPAPLHLPLDDLPTVIELRDVVRLLRPMTEGQGIVFRVADFPGVTVAWRRWNTAALAMAFVHRRLVHADVVMLGMESADDALSLSAAIEMLAVTPDEAKQIGSQPRPLLVRFSIGAEEDHFCGLLGLVLVMPAMCELYGFE